MLALLDSLGQVVELVPGTEAIDHWSGLGPAVVIDGMNPMPGVGWTTSDGGQTFQPPPPDSVLANRAALQTKMSQALQVNKTYLALSPPSQAQVLQQVDRLTREVSALIRLQTGQLDSQDST